MSQNNVPNHKITKIVGVHRKTVTRTIQNYIDRKDLVTKNRSGRPKLINDENKKNTVILFCQKNFGQNFLFLIIGLIKTLKM